MGTREVSVYVVVDLFVGLTAQFLGGFAESLVTLLGHSIGAGNKILSGQYVQLAILFFTAFYIPLLIMWDFIIEDLIVFLGFDQESAQIGKAFAMPYLFGEFIKGVSNCIHAVLDVTDHAFASTFLTSAGDILKTLVLLTAILLDHQLTLRQAGFFYVLSDSVMFVFSALFIHRKRWISEFYSGLFGTFAGRVSHEDVHMRKNFDCRY